MTEPPDDDRHEWWTDTYREEEDLPWDTGRPQSAIVGFVDDGWIEGRILDLGCGLGTEALALAGEGHDVVGVDVAPPAVERTRRRAADRSVAGEVAFEVADALGLRRSDLGTVDTVLDVGTFHTVAPGDRADYVGSVGSVLRDEGRVILLEFGAEAPEDWGPTPVSAADLRRAFAEGWTVDRVEAAPFETRQGDVPGILAAVERTGGI